MATAWRPSYVRSPEPALSKPLVLQHQQTHAQCYSESCSDEDGDVHQAASVYHLYRLKRKLSTVCSLISEINKKQTQLCLNSSRKSQIIQLESRILCLKQSLVLLNKMVSRERQNVERRKQILSDRARRKYLLERKSQLVFQKDNLQSHLNNAKLSLRIKNAYLKCLRQQFLHSLLSDIFPILCTDVSNIVTEAASTAANSKYSVVALNNSCLISNAASHGGSSSSAVDSTLLSSVAPSSLNNDQFTQLDEAIHTHYLGQGFWSNDEDDNSQMRLNSHAKHSYGMLSISLSQPEKYDQLVNLIDRLYSTQQRSFQINNRYRQCVSSASSPHLSSLPPKQVPAICGTASRLKLDSAIVARAYEQSAALCHLSQLMYMSSYILSVPLPFRPNYSFFMGFDYSPRALHDAICKLDLNVIFLCLSQGVHSSKLRCDHNIKNLVHCFSTSNPHLGDANVVFSLDFDLMHAVEDFFTRYDSLNRMRFNRTEHDGDDDDVTNDWEELPENVTLTDAELQHIHDTCKPPPLRHSHSSISLQAPTMAAAAAATAVLSQNPPQIITSSAAYLSSLTSWLSTQASNSIKSLSSTSSETTSSSVPNINNENINK